MARRYAEAVEAFKRIAAPVVGQLAFLAACHAQMDDESAASKHVHEVLKQEPAFSVEPHLDTLHYKQDGDRDHHRACLLKAGLPA